MLVVQTMLQQPSENGYHCKVAWLPVDARVKKGSVLTLKDEPESGKWKVIETYSTQPVENIQRHWGLNLPRSQRTER